MVRVTEMLEAHWISRCLCFTSRVDVGVRVCMMFHSIPQSVTPRAIQLNNQPSLLMLREHEEPEATFSSLSTPTGVLSLSSEVLVKLLEISN